MKHFINIVFYLTFGTVYGQTLVVLGTLQDGGSPHMNCEKPCCAVPKANDYVASLGVYDSTLAVLFDATPDIVPQLGEILERSGSKKYSVFLTHAHMGHYTGLAHFGREAANTKKVPVYAMPRMIDFLAKNGPWNQLLKLQNITLNGLQEGVPRTLKNGLIVEPFLVPHRDEFSETVGYYIKRKGGKVALYIPDIDKWEEWEENIIAVIPRVDYAFIDGTFFADGEVPRPMSEVPHPFISESAKLFGYLPRKEREKIYFIHLNHSNPARNADFEGRKALEAEGMHFAEFGQEFSL
jgi:pyrroloquinoline quinone biosynthesis protein B